MFKFLINKSNLILTVAVFVFLVSYILFSSLSTSLDFKMDRVTQKQNEVREEYELTLSALTQAQSKDSLMALSAGLGLVEITLANGYVDIRPEALSSVSTLANKQ